MWKLEIAESSSDVLCDIKGNFLSFLRNKKVSCTRWKWILNWKLEWFSLKAKKFIKRLFSSINRFFPQWAWASKENKMRGFQWEWFFANLYFSRGFLVFISTFQLPADHENSIKIDSRDDVGVDVDNDDDLPMGDIDSGDHDSNDMTRPRKIRR